MGVHGLWRLIEPSGKPVPLETLENKVLAVDISIWLHQAVKGFQDSRGGALPNAHLLGIYHRVCKLLYFKIKPVFVFDGGVPVLKKQTIAKRNQSKSKNLSDADRVQKQLLATLVKHSAINKVLSDKVEEAVESVKKNTRQNVKDNLYVLPNTDFDSTLSSSEDEPEKTESTSDSSPTKHWDLHNIDPRSLHFKSLPADVRHEILTDLKETRKQSSWGRLHEIPTFSDDFSTYQMDRLLKRQSVQAALEETEKEMGGHSLSLAELESLLKDQGVIISNPNVGNRIASDENKRFLLIKDTKKAMDEARKEKSKLETVKEITNEKDSNSGEEEKVKTIAELEFEDDLQAAIALSLQESEISQPSTSRKVAFSSTSSVNSTTKSIENNKLELSFFDNFTDADFASASSSDDESFQELSAASRGLSCAQSYMMEYTGLTPSEIGKIIDINRGVSEKKRKQLEGVKERSATAIPVEVRTTESTSTVDADTTQMKIEDVEIMSSASSDSSVDFVEVTESQSNDNDLLKINKNAFEIVVDPNEKISDDDDLFSEIFQKEDCNTIRDTDGTIKVRDSGLKIKSPATHDGSSNLSQESVKLDKVVNVPVEEITGNRDSVNRFSTEKISQDKEANRNKTQEEVGIVGEPKGKEKCDGKCDVIAIPDNKNVISELISIEDKQQNFDTISTKQTFSVEDLRRMKEELQRQTNELMSEKATKERMAGNITHQIYQESQELLNLFGVPYIIAPMEAEAQCAFLDEINLTDGTITDDSDIWLFGGKTVYKNFFNQAKYVLEFKAENIEHHFKLTREQMILLALLVGSDYTVGLQGVGPVTALEILSTFPPARVQEFSLCQNQLTSGDVESKMSKRVKAAVENIGKDPSERISEELEELKQKSIKKPRRRIKEFENDILETNKRNRRKKRGLIENLDANTDSTISSENVQDCNKVAKNVTTKANKSALDNEDMQTKSTSKSKRIRKNKSQVEATVASVSNIDTKMLTESQDKLEGSQDEMLEKIQKIRTRRRLKDAVAPKEAKKQKTILPKKSQIPPLIDNISEDLAVDSEVRLLQEIASASVERVYEINSKIERELSKITPTKTQAVAVPVDQGKLKRVPTIVHKKETIPQKDRDKTVLLRNKFKAIEVFRKGKKGPGYVQKRTRKKRLLKEDAGLSESSDD